MRYFAKFFVMLLFVSAICFTGYLPGQTVIDKRDSVIEKMIAKISAGNIKTIVSKLVGFKTRHSLSDTLNDKTGIGAARSWVKSEMLKYADKSDGRLNVNFDPFIVKADGRRIPNNVTMKNIIAELKGTDPKDNRVFLISAHLDSRNKNIMDSAGTAPGADDDGSGVAAVMELARIMSEYNFPAKIIFAIVSGEEQGLYGSAHLAEKAKDENWNLVAMLNNDMIGNSSSGGTMINDNLHVRVFSEGIPSFETDKMKQLRLATGAENDGPSRQLARYVKEIGERYVDQLKVILNFRRDRFLRGGDHTPFNKAGFTAVRLCEMNENYTHQHQNIEKIQGEQLGDLPEFVDCEYVRKITGINLAVLANLNFAPAAPRNAVVDVKQLSNFTKLKWKSPKGRKPAGYFILIRETYQPLWQKKIFVKNTEATLPYSKDNYFFAVQSVDENGHESLPVFPVPVFR